MSFRIGVDIGGTSAKVALVNDRNRIVREDSVSTAGFPNARLMADRLAEVCRDLGRGHGVKRVGSGVAGDIDSEKGVVRVSPNLGFKNLPLKKLMQDRLKWAVAVENDAKAAAWG